MYEARLAAIVMAMRHGEVLYRQHALDRMSERGITQVLVERAFDASDPEVIEDYPDDERGPSCLVLCLAGGRTLHVQLTYPPRPQVITAYWPDEQPHRWSGDFRRRVR